MNYTIRKFIPEKEEKALKELILEFKKYEAEFEEAFRLDQEAIEELYKEEMIREGKYVYVIEHDNNLIGFIAFENSSKNDPLITHHVDAVYIGALYVKPEYRGQGLGQKLMEKAEEYSRENKIKFIKLLLFTKNKLAKDFYEKSGYSDYETTMVKEV